MCVGAVEYIKQGVVKAIHKGDVKDAYISVVEDFLCGCSKGVLIWM